MFIDVDGFLCADDFLVVFEQRFTRFLDLLFAHDQSVYIRQCVQADRFELRDIVGVQLVVDLFAARVACAHGDQFLVAVVGGLPGFVDNGARGADKDFCVFFGFFGAFVFVYQRFQIVCFGLCDSFFVFQFFAVHGDGYGAIDDREQFGIDVGQRVGKHSRVRAVGFQFVR